MNAEAHCENLDDYLDGELDAIQAERFELHLLSCTLCAETLARQREIDAELKAAWSRVSLSVDQKSSRVGSTCEPGASEQETFTTLARNKSCQFSEPQSTKKNAGSLPQSLLVALLAVAALGVMAFAVWRIEWPDKDSMTAADLREQPEVRRLPESDSQKAATQDALAQGNAAQAQASATYDASSSESSFSSPIAPISQSPTTFKQDRSFAIPVIDHADFTLVELYPTQQPNGRQRNTSHRLLH